MWHYLHYLRHSCCKSDCLCQVTCGLQNAKGWTVCSSENFGFVLPQLFISLLLSVVWQCHSHLRIFFCYFSLKRFSVSPLAMVTVVTICMVTVVTTCMRWRSCCRQCAASWKVTSSIPYGIYRIFLCPNPSGRSNGNEYKRCVLGVKAVAVRRADILFAFLC